MGGKGSGRPPKPETLIRLQQQEKRTPIATEMFIPNHSGVSTHPEVIANYLKIDGSNANQNIDIGAYTFTANQFATSKIEMAANIILASDELRLETAGTDDIVLNAGGDIDCSNDLIKTTSNMQAAQLISTVAGGTAPLTVTSTTKVTNLNADLLDGYNTGTSGNAIPLMDGANTWSDDQTFDAATKLIFRNSNSQIYSDASGFLDIEAVTRLDITAGITTTSASLAAGTTLISNNTKATGAYLILEGWGAQVTSRGAHIEWNANAVSDLKGYNFCNNLGRFCWDNTAQSSAADTGSAWVNFATGACSFAGANFTIDSSGIAQAGGYKSSDGSAGITAVITTAKLTAGGANGSMTFKNGILTAQTQAT